MCVFVQPPHCATNNEDEKLQNGSRHRAPLKSRATFVESLHLTIGLCHSLNLILLLDGIAVGGLLGSVHDLIGQALRNGLDVSEGAVASTGAQQVDGLIDASQGGDINRLTTDNTSRANSSGVLPRATVLDGLNVHLEGVLVREEVDDLEGMLDDADSHHLLAVVAAVHHHGAAQSLDDGAESLSELLLLEPALGVRKEGLTSLDGNVVHQGEIFDLDIVAPLSEELDLGGSHGGCYWEAQQGAAMVEKRVEEGA
mmetsp:Transcript_36978/g.55876  ORF Transcript_36978/g.55876 Transcript_36978/m.55876 type:complete len:255 (-) Transcript_36978:22-786(-)